MKSIVILTMVFVTCLSCRQPYPELPETNGVEPPEFSDDIKSVTITGEFDDLQLQVDGLPLFEPLAKDLSLSQNENAERIFEWVAEHFTVWNVALGQQPEEYLFGFGYGLCGVESLVMAALWHEHGLESRLVAWPRHTMAEARVAEEWRLFDAQHKTDFSASATGAVSFDDVKRAGEVHVVHGLDPIGYDGDYLRELFREAEPDFKPVRHRLPRPVLRLAKGQDLTIRRRSSDTATPLPIQEPPETQPRTHLVPLFEIVLRHQFDERRDVTFDLGLPLLTLESDRTLARVAGDKEVRDQPNAATLAETFTTEHRPITISAEPGTSVTLTYALAPWVGERLFDGLKRGAVTIDAADAALSMEPNRDPRLWIKSLEGLATLHEPQTLSVTLAWDRIHQDEPLTATVFLDELSSSLPLEAWEYIHRWDWTWDPKTMGAQGEVILTKQWKPRPQHSRYRPGSVRTLLAHLKSKSMPSGVKHTVQRQFILEE